MQPVTEPAGAMRARSGRFVDNGTLGMALFVFTEVMLFSGFLSAFVIVKAGATPGAWPPADQPRLPIERTALNTLALLASGVTLWFAGRMFRRGGAAQASGWMSVSLLLGTAFVVLQGMEWTALLRHGLTLQSSQLGSFFYVIVGAHALHAIVALAILAGTWTAMRAGTLRASRFGAAQLFWYFVVLVWPALYWMVYL